MQATLMSVPGIKSTSKVRSFGGNKHGFENNEIYRQWMV